MLSTIPAISEFLKGEWILSGVLPSMQRAKDVDWFIRYWDIVIRGNAIPGLEKQGISAGTMLALILGIVGSAIIFFVYSRIRRRKLLVAGKIGRVQAKNRVAPPDVPQETNYTSPKFKFANNLLDRIFNLLASDRKRRKSLERIDSKAKFGRLNPLLLEHPKQESLAPSTKSAPKRLSAIIFGSRVKAKTIERMPAVKKSEKLNPGFLRSIISNRPANISMAPKPASKFKKLFARSGRAGPIKRVSSIKGGSPNRLISGSIFGTRSTAFNSERTTKPPLISKTRYRRGGKRATDIKRVKPRKERS